MVSLHSNKTLIKTGKEGRKEENMEDEKAPKPQESYLS